MRIRLDGKTKEEREILLSTLEKVMVTHPNWPVTWNSSKHIFTRVSVGENYLLWKDRYVESWRSMTGWSARLHR